MLLSHHTMDVVMLYYYIIDRTMVELLNCNVRMNILLLFLGENNRLEYCVFVLLHKSTREIIFRGEKQDNIIL